MAARAKREPERRRTRPAGVSRRRPPDEARREILEVGEDFLLRHPFRELTVEGLMQSTTIGRSAFYAYFADRFALAEALLIEIRSDLVHAAHRWLYEPGDDPVDALAQSLVEVVKVWRRIGPLLRALSDAATQDERLERIYQDVVTFNDRAVSDAIRRDQAAGLIDAAIQPDQTAMALNRLNLSYLYEHLGRRSRRRLAPITNTLQEIWGRTLYRKAL